MYYSVHHNNTQHGIFFLFSYELWFWMLTISNNVSFGIWNNWKWLKRFPEIFWQFEVWMTMIYRWQDCSIANKLDLLQAICGEYSLIDYNDIIMGAMASQITSLTIVYSTVYSGADQRKHQSSASLAFARGIHRSPQRASNAENVSIWWRHQVLGNNNDTWLSNDDVLTHLKKYNKIGVNSWCIELIWKDMYIYMCTSNNS